MQWASLKANGLDESGQFNTLYEALTEQFRELKRQNPAFEPTLLISTMEGYPEDDTNMQVLGEAAREAGFEVAFEHVENVEFSEEGIYKQNDEDGSFTKFDFWFQTRSLGIYRLGRTRIGRKSHANCERPKKPL